MVAGDASGIGAADYTAIEPAAVAAAGDLTAEEARAARVAEVTSVAPVLPEVAEGDAPAVQVVSSGADGAPSTVLEERAVEVPFDPIAHGHVMRVYVDPADDRGVDGPAQRVDVRLAGGGVLLGTAVPASYASRPAHQLRSVPFDRPVVDPSSGEIRERWEVR